MNKKRGMNSANTISFFFVLAEFIRRLKKRRLDQTRAEHDLGLKKSATAKVNKIKYAVANSPNRRAGKS